MYVGLCMCTRQLRVLENRAMCALAIQKNNFSADAGMLGLAPAWFDGAGEWMAYTINRSGPSRLASFVYALGNFVSFALATEERSCL